MSKLTQDELTVFDEMVQGNPDVPTNIIAAAFAFSKGNVDDEVIEYAKIGYRLLETVFRTDIDSPEECLAIVMDIVESALGMDRAIELCGLVDGLGSDRW